MCHLAVSQDLEYVEFFSGAGKVFEEVHGSAYPCTAVDIEYLKGIPHRGKSNPFDFMTPAGFASFGGTFYCGSLCFHPSLLCFHNWLCLKIGVFDDDPKICFKRLYQKAIFGNFYLKTDPYSFRVFSSLCIYVSIYK